MTYVLLTRAPLYRGRSPFSHDLHVLSAPLTFVLSQDQTLQFESFGKRRGAKPPRCHDGSLCYSAMRRAGELDVTVLTTRFLAGNRTQFSRTEGRIPSRRGAAEPSPDELLCQKESSSPSDKFRDPFGSRAGALPTLAHPSCRSGQKGRYS
jgi:hypothetical protein